MTIAPNAKIKVYRSGKVTNLRGNNSNHSISFGSICVWGKKCCTGNYEIIGPDSISDINPCNTIALELKRSDTLTIDISTFKILECNKSESSEYFIPNEKLPTLFFIRVIGDNQNITEYKSIRIDP